VTNLMRISVFMNPSVYVGRKVCSDPAKTRKKGTENGNFHFLSVVAVEILDVEVGNYVQKRYNT
jgi:hypothetical protein